MEGLSSKFRHCPRNRPITIDQIGILCFFRRKYLEIRKFGLWKACGYDKLGTTIWDKNKGERLCSPLWSVYDLGHYYVF